MQPMLDRSARWIRSCVVLGVVTGLGVLATASCSDPSAQGADAQDAAKVDGPKPLPDLDSVHTTFDRTFVPSVTRQASADGPNPSLPDALKYYEGMGFGTIQDAPGWGRIERTVDGEPPPASSGPNRKRLLRFVHMPDLQVADDESPSRLALLDMPTQIDAAMRPQDADLCRMLNACVRTIRGHHAKDPFSFLLLGGDNVDNAQSNELGWVLGTLGGSDDIECDSGADDDPVPGPGNDGKDPYASPGLGFPFYWVTGNHDVEVQGNVGVDADQSAVTVSDTAPNAAPMAVPTGPATVPIAAPVASPPSAAPKPVPTGCAPGSPVIGSRLRRPMSVRSLSGSVSS